ncbi:MAG TPA: geranylgeranyl reductase family protein [Solirubrobacterales bacterium]|nr:geranylgeranyl reductase family protein [Solirubrobacterales bacterium]
MTADSTSRIPPLIDEAEVVVVGAGPAGSRCAARLAETGHDVLLLDKSSFPREKPCGDGVTETSVRALRELELDDLLEESQEVWGLRAFVGHEPETRSFRRPSRCISRLEMDSRLLGAARERGARFAQIRVNGPLTDGGAVVGVSTADGEAIRARCVIAADGATSRLRRECGFAPAVPGRRAYAIRRYFRSELPLDSFFDIFVPLFHGSTELLGYGWVFPLDEKLANVGVGCYRPGSSIGLPALSVVLDAFIEELALVEGDRYGTLSPIEKPIGSPVGVGFAAGRCQFQRVLFVGDAAQMTDPITGEGIGHALYGGGLVADVAHAALTGRRGADWHSGLDLGREIDRRMLRLGQDMDVLRRVAVRRLNRPDKRLVAGRDKVGGKPFLKAAAHATASFYEVPTLEGTSISIFAAEQDAEVSEAVAALNERALDEFLTRFPFVPQTLHRELRSDAGPAAGTLVLLASRSTGKELDSTAVSVALAIELLAMFPIFLAQAVNRPSGEASKLNNTFAILTADYVVSRALSCAAPAGTAVVGAIAGAGCSMCESEADVKQTAGGAEARLEAYPDPTRGREGSLFELAASVGGCLSKTPADAIGGLRSYGRSLGAAFCISNDVCEVAGAEGKTPGPRATPVKGGVLDQALLRCEELADTAREALAEVGLNGSLAALCDLPGERARSAVGAAGDRRLAIP